MEGEGERGDNRRIMCDDPSLEGLGVGVLRWMARTSMHSELISLDLIAILHAYTFVFFNLHIQLRTNRELSPNSSSPLTFFSTTRPVLLQLLQFQVTAV